jgi:hypothetical protein
MDGGIGESMLLSAAIGGGASALKGGNLQQDLMGAALGGLGGAAFSGLGGMMGDAAAAAPAASVGGASGVAGDVAATQSLGSSLGNADTGLTNIGNTGLSANPSQAMPGGAANYSLSSAANAGNLGINPSQISGMGVDPSAGFSSSGIGSTGALNTAGSLSNIGSGLGNNISDAVASSQPGASQGIMSQLGDKFSNLSTTQKLMLGGGAGLGALMLADRNRYGVPKQKPYTGPLSQFNYNPATFTPTTFNNTAYVPHYADGGIAALAGGGLSHGSSRSGALRSTLGMLHGVEHLSEFSHGGALGGYSDGGQMLKGPGDGMSDSIPAHIDDKQPARLADGEFVVPADVVSHLGNGSTDAGAKTLYDMMDKVRKARTGNSKQGKQINASKFLPT